MKRNYITYEQSGVKSIDKDKKANYIAEIIKKYPTSKDKYAIGGIGEFAGMFDFARFIQERNFVELVSETFRKYGERKAPYILAAYWLQNRLNLQKLRIR